MKELKETHPLVTNPIPHLEDEQRWFTDTFVCRMVVLQPWALEIVEVVKVALK